MKLKKLIMMAVAATAISTLSANNCNYSDNSCCPSFLDDVSIYGDWLYWKARKCDLDYAVPYNENTTPEQIIGKVKKVCPKWESGFRVGVEKACDCWAFGADYSWLRSSASDSVTDLNGDLASTHLTNDNISSLSPGNIQFARGRWNLDYDLVNATAAYTCCSCGCLDAKIFSGFIYSHIGQQLKSFYSETTNFTGTNNVTVHATQDWDMDGYGMTFGFAPNYCINRCLNVFGIFSYSALAADYSRKLKFTQSVNGGVTSTTTVNLKDDCWRVSSLVKLACGLRYNIVNPCNCGADIGLSIQYEFQQWLNTPGFLDITNTSNQFGLDRYQSDLGFDGLVLGLDVQF